MYDYDSARGLLADANQRRAARNVVARGGKYYDGPAPRPVIVEAVGILKARHDRRSCRGQAEKARKGEPGRILHLVEQRAAERERKRRERQRKRIADGKLGARTVRRMLRSGELTKFGMGTTNSISDGIVRSLVASVGTIGDQAERDLAELRAYEDFGGKRGRNHKLEGSEVHSVQEGRGKALLITMCDFCSFGSSGPDGYDSRGGRSYRCFLVVRDTTTGEAHILRVPPKYGNDNTQFYGKFKGPRERVHAAIAWTFNLKPEEYRPTVQA